MTNLDATDARLRIVNRKINPLLESLPDWVESYRPHQMDAVGSVLDAFKYVDVVILDAPTGSGKTLIGETIGRLMQTPRVYCCTEKSLQDQFMRDFPDAKLLKGRSNYPTINQRDRFHPEDYLGHVSCEDCQWSITKSCDLCPTKFVCPYETAKMDALHAEVAVLNTSYLLTECNGPGRFSKQRLVIVDEADTLESSLMNHVSVDVTEKRLSRYGWEVPSHVTVSDSWREWIGLHLPDIDHRLSGLDVVSGNLGVLREAKFLSQLKQRLQNIDVGLGDGYWAYTGRGAKDFPGRGVAFRPARVDLLGQQYLWRHSQKWLLMTATPISSQEMMSSLGYDKQYETVRLPNTFPVENRQVFFRGSVSMSFKNRENNAWDQMAEAITKDLSRHRDDRVLIHTVSYGLADHLTAYLSKKSGRKFITYRNAQGRVGALAEYLDTPASVLIAPSMGRGVDLPGDACRVQMISKVPFPYLKDRQVSMRMHSRGGQLWYSVQTVRTIVQMCGRAIRSKDDWAVTYIYDRDFQSNLWRKSRNLFPKWFQEAIVWREGMG